MTQVSHLPLTAPELVDRERELSYVTRQLSAGSRLVTLVGPAGVGKTHLAIHAALRLQDNFERVAFVDLTSTDLSSKGTSHPQQFTEALLKSSGLADSAQLVHELGAYKTLLVLDSFESVLGAAPSLSDLLVRCPTLSVLVTSRSPLGLRFETSTELHPFTPSSAYTFFVSCAKAANPPYALESYHEAIQKLCERLDGLPLALELAAARTAHMTPQALLAHLEQHVSLPRLDLPDRPERHQNLGVMIDSSVALLSESERHFFRRLGVIAGHFSVETAEAITAARELGLETLSTLIKLRSYGLLSSELTTPPRFRMLATAKSFALASFRTEKTPADTWVPDDLACARTRHLHHYHALAARHAELLKGNMLGGLEFFSREQANICAALRWGLESNDSELKNAGLGLVVATYAFWHVRGQISEAHAWLEAFRGTYPPPLQAAWLWALASAKTLLDDNQEGIALAKEALRLGHALKDKTLIAKALTQLGHAHKNLDHFSRALEHSQAACALAKELGAMDIYIAALNNSALVYEQLGQTAEARRCFEEALQVASALDNLFWQALCTNNLALLASYEERVPLFQKSLELLRQLGDNKRMSLVFVNLTDTHYRLGHYEAAQQFAAEGLAIARQAGDRFHIALNFNNLGLLTRQRNDVGGAEHYFGEALAIFRELGVRSREAEVLADWARCYHDDPPRPAKQYLSALNIALETKTCVSIVSCLDGLAELELLSGRFADAVLVWSVGKKLWGHHTSQNFMDEELFEKSKARLSSDELATTLQKGATLSPQQLFYDLSKVWGLECKRKILDVLSLRQQDILKLVAQGYPNKKIAKVFGLSEPTVKYHLREIFDKLGVNSRTEAVIQATQRGLLSVEKTEA
jgi:non-specific serine/threonine protein kinase